MEQNDLRFCTSSTQQTPKHVYVYVSAVFGEREVVSNTSSTSAEDATQVHDLLFFNRYEPRV
jgi:hypothetical protein